MHLHLPDLNIGRQRIVAEGQGLQGFGALGIQYLVQDFLVDMAEPRFLDAHRGAVKGDQIGSVWKILNPARGGQLPRQVILGGTGQESQ